MEEFDFFSVKYTENFNTKRNFKLFLKTLLIVLPEILHNYMLFIILLEFIFSYAFMSSQKKVISKYTIECGN